jgi:hypothetical protein
MAPTVAARPEGSDGPPAANPGRSEGDESPFGLPDGGVTARAGR